MRKEAEKLFGETVLRDVIDYFKSIEEAVLAQKTEAALAKLSAPLDVETGAAEADQALGAGKEALGAGKEALGEAMRVLSEAELFYDGGTRGALYGCPILPSRVTTLLKVNWIFTAR